MFFQSTLISTNVQVHGASGVTSGKNLSVRGERLGPLTVCPRSGEVTSVVVFLTYGGLVFIPLYDLMVS